MSSFPSSKQKTKPIRCFITREKFINLQIHFTDKVLFIYQLQISKSFTYFILTCFMTLLSVINNFPIICSKGGDMMPDIQQPAARKIKWSLIKKIQCCQNIYFSLILNYFKLYFN